MAKGHVKKLSAVVAVLATLAAAQAAQALDPGVEAQNYSKGRERSAIYNTPEYRALLAQVSTQNEAASVAMQAADPERNFQGHLCARGDDGCAGDARLYDWQAKGYGIVQPVLFTARNGATLSGHVWATRSGPASRPAISITNGSVQADEQLYWFVAQTLAKAGYVVLTWDPQGQGQSDERGEAPDESEGSPAQTDGRPFFDGTEDAIDFLLSTPGHPYVPVPSCSTGTSHAAKQRRRVGAGLNAAYNPFWQLIDPSRIGIAGHSYGASGVSYIGQWDSRVKAIVAFDNLGSTDPNEPTGASGGGPREEPCPANPAARTVAPIAKPALGMSADYFIPPEPNTSDPEPLAKSRQSFVYSKAGVDTGEIVIRGGTHYDFDWIPNMGFPATLRGADEIDWYTTAWFDKYLKGDPTADRRLVTNRWRSVADEADVDPNHDGNMFSFYYPSRLDIGLAGGGRFKCENIRPGCPGMVGDDGYAGDYSYVKIATTPDGTAGGAARGVAAGGVHGCGAAAGAVVRLRSRRGLRVVRASVFINGRRVSVQRGKRLRKVRIPAPGPGVHRVKIVLRTSRGRTLRSVRTYNGCRKSRPRRLSHR